MARKPTPMSKPHKVIVVPGHVKRDGTKVRGHSRRVPVKLAPPYVPPVGNDNGAGYSDWTAGPSGPANW